MEEPVERSFFNFTMFDENKNTVDLGEFRGKDAIVVVNCRTPEEVKAKSPKYYELEDKFEKRVQILCLLGLEFLYHSHEEESKTLIDYLKEKTNLHETDEDGLTFIVDNKGHSPIYEKIKYLGRNITYEKLVNEIFETLK